MINRRLNWLNYTILAAILVFSGILFYFRLNRLDEINLVDPQNKHSGLPKGAFELTDNAYEAISGPFLSLSSSMPTLQLPDLKTQLIYHGRNGRPDAQLNNIKLHFSLAGSKQVIPIDLQKKMYLEFDKSSKQTKYQFSPDNEKTGLWFETALGENNEVIVNVVMEDEKGEKVTSPPSHAQFRLPEKDFVKTGETWEMGSFRVDGTILARLKARWFGRDRFLENHGGKAFENIENKQRVDFGENNDIYSVFVKAGDCMIWDSDRLRVVEPGEDSIKHPLLVVKKVDDRLMSFELWDVDGKGKIPLNLLKSNEPWSANNTQMIQQSFKFVGARTKTQSLFEINKVRMVLKPYDWLIMTPKGWKKLESEEEIDRFVQRKDAGLLFVFEGRKNKEDRQVMIGTLYNSSRCECQKIELTMQNAKPKSSPKKPVVKVDDDDDDDDDDELIDKMISTLKQNKDANEKMKKEVIKKEQSNKKVSGKPNTSPQKPVKSAPTTQKIQTKQGSST